MHVACEVGRSGEEVAVVGFSGVEMAAGGLGEREGKGQKGIWKVGEKPLGNSAERWCLLDRGCGRCM